MNGFSLVLTLLLTAGVASATAASGSEPAAAPLSTEISPELKREHRVEADNFFRHRDNYFLSGNPNAKVQLSLKLRPVISVNVYFAYTQIMFWKLSADSKPFRDINFNPELYYEWQRPDRFVKALRFGVEHKSNGRDGVESRSYDRVFSDLVFETGLAGYQLQWDTRLFWIYDVDWRTNRDISEYTSFFTTRVSIDGVFENLFPGKAELYMQFNPGGRAADKLRYSAIETGLKVRARLFQVMPYVMFQYYYGYMESMLTYSEPSHSYRLGFVF